MPEQPENLSVSLFHSLDNDYAKEALIEMSSSLLDSATKTILHSDALAKLPVVGGVVALGKGALDFRDRQFVSKLLRVLAETSGATGTKKAEFKAKLDADPSTANKAGAILLDIIDKATGAEKAAMIGKVIRAAIEEELDTSLMIDLSEMIQKAYLSDLRALARADDEPGPAWSDINLEGIGVKKPIRTEDVNKAIKAVYGQTMSKMPIIHEGITPPSVDPTITESGFTDTGDILVRILRVY